MTAFQPSAPYAPPRWAMPPDQRSRLAGLVEQALRAHEPVLVTHDSPDDIARRLDEGFAIGDHYRRQLESYRSARPGEDLSDTVFAALSFRPRGSTAPTAGADRYGPVAIEWSPELVAGSSFTPLISALPEEAARWGASGVQAGGAGDLPEVVTDALLAQHGYMRDAKGTPFLADERAVERRELEALLTRPDAQAVQGVAELITGPEMRAMPIEAVVRGARPDQVARLLIATVDRSRGDEVPVPPDDPNIQRIRAWAGAHGAPIETV